MSYIFAFLFLSSLNVWAQADLNSKPNSSEDQNQLQPLRLQKEENRIMIAEDFKEFILKS